MDQAIQESIHHFEHKKEFREVKLKTRQSFREDQVALERRLSKRTDGRRTVNSMPNGETSGETKANGVISKLESIVLDIGVEKEKKKSTDEITVSESDENSSRKNSVNSDKLLDEERKIVQKGPNDTNQKVKTNDKTEVINVPHQNGYITDGNQNLNGSYGLVPNVHSLIQNGQSSGPSTLVMRPKVTVQARPAMTPEPRLKSLRGIYQKNPKLTASSTEHLDNVSLNGFKLTANAYGQKTEYQKVTVPVIPGAEVTSIPADGNLSGFNTEQMVTVFRLLKLPEELVYRLSKCKVDGKRFSVFSDTELRDMGMNNPIIRYFRDRTAQRAKKKPPKFML